LTRGVRRHLHRATIVAGKCFTLRRESVRFWLSGKCPNGENVRSARKRRPCAVKNGTVSMAVAISRRRV